MIELEIRGLEQFQRQLRRLSESMRGQVVQDALMAGGYIIEGYAKTEVPVDTGFLRSSIQTARGPDDTVVVSAEAEYAAYVEYGTSRMAARPYMRPAAEEHMPEIEQAIAAAMSDALAKAMP